jgi:cyclic pyranopterin phosphate synthase
MVDITDKKDVVRTAEAEGFIRLKPETVKLISEGKISKGNVVEVAKTAAVLATKRVPELVPLTHPIPITGVDVEAFLEEAGVRMRVRVKSIGKTGVEMEALTGVVVGLLTVWDMVKGLEKDERGQYPSTFISDVRVVEKVKQ